MNITETRLDSRQRLSELYTKLEEQDINEDLSFEGRVSSHIPHDSHRNLCKFRYNGNLKIQLNSNFSGSKSNSKNSKRYHVFSENDEFRMTFETYGFSFHAGDPNEEPYVSADEVGRNSQIRFS